MNESEKKKNIIVNNKSDLWNTAGVRRESASSQRKVWLVVP